MRARTPFDFDWKFCLGDHPKALTTDFDDSDWRQLDLPHDWSVEFVPDLKNPAQAGGGFFPGGIGWYRKSLSVPSDLGDDRLLLAFDGVYMNSEVWCNGRLCGVRPYGYSSFCYDITPFVKPGAAASIAVRVDNARQKNSRWYSGSGIYRHVWLTQVAPVHVANWGTYVTTPEVSETRATVACQTTVENDSTAAVSAVLQSTLVSPAGEGRIQCQSDVVEIGAGQSVDVAATCDVKHPRLWSPETPALYTLLSEVVVNGETVDRYETRCGIRSVWFDPDEGFFLNGNSVKMKGVNEHHDAGCVGAAVPDEMIRRRFRILKAMGCNAIRVAHNPASPIFLDLCDQMGFLVVEDAFDEWREGKTPFGYQLYWDQWWERDLVDMIRRDRNHPSIVLWSVGNEIVEVREGKPEGLPIMADLRDVCRREDATRPMTCGCCATRKTLAGGYGPLMDVVGYNGGGGSCFDYEKDHKTYPEMIIFASEVPHSLQTRGVYRTKTWYRDLTRNPGLERLEVPDLCEEELFTEFDEHYQSSYDNAMVRISSIDSWRLTKTLPFMCGEFRWTGFDYIGECYAWPAKSWNFGIIDLCGFPKDTYFFYQSEWTDAPMVHLLPHWTWPGLEGKSIPVVGYSNCEKVELCQDGTSLGEQAMEDAMQVRWDVPYRAGTLKAVGYRNGEAVASCVHETAGAPRAIKLESEEQRISAGRTGIAHVKASVIDQAGRMVPHADHELTFEVEGPAKLIGLENGDPIDSTHYQASSRKVFHGMMLAVVQGCEGKGTVEIRATAAGLQGCSISVEKLS